MHKRKKNYYLNLWIILSLLVSLFYKVPLYATSPDELPHLTSEAAILIEAHSGKILYEKNAHEIYYPASITKIMTALLVMENLKPTDIITFSRDAIYGIERGSSNIGILVGEQITVDQALRGLLLDSANEVANGLAEAVSGSVDNFAVAMTNRAKAIGAQNTKFLNPHGLHDEGHYTTAYDMAYITREIYNNEYFLEIMAQPTFEIPPTNKSTVSRPLSQQHGMMNEKRNSVLYRSDVIGGKTGYTDQARHTLVTIARKGDVDLIAVVMKSPTKQSMYDETNKLFDYGFNSYHTIQLHDPSATLKALPVYAIKSGELYETAAATITVATNQSLLINKNVKLRDITTKLNIPEYLSLGVQEKDSIGTIDYIYNQEIIASDELVISALSFVPSPFQANSPQKSNLISSFWVVLFILFLILLLFLILTVSRRRKTRFRRARKLKFSKTIK